METQQKMILAFYICCFVFFICSVICAFRYERKKQQEIVKANMIIIDQIFGINKIMEAQSNLLGKLANGFEIMAKNLIPHSKENGK